MPATVSSGISAGSTIASSYFTTTISTAITVPQVAFVTVSGTSTASAVLIAGTGPASVNAGMTTMATTPAQTTLSIATSSSGNSTAKATPSLVTANSGARNTMTLRSVVAALVFAALAL